MNKGVDKLWQLGKRSANELIDQLGMTWDEVVRDFREFRVNQLEKMDEWFDAWTEDDTIYELFEGFRKASRKGWDAAVDYLRGQNRELQQYLDKQARLTPHMVGGVDGFLRVYLDTPAKRWARSPRYQRGVKMGRIFGILCAFTVFLPISVGKALIAVLPGASRAAKYVDRKWNAARDKRAPAKRYAGA